MNKVVYERALVNFFREHAYRGHTKQRRRNGDYYISHCNQVEQRVIKLVGEVSDLFIYQAVAMAHDLKEDQRAYWDENVLGEAVARGYGYILDYIDAITKKPKGEEGYVSYLERVASNPYSLAVKLADLDHNLSDLEPGNLKDKYELTVVYLQNKRNTFNKAQTSFDVYG